MLSFRLSDDFVSQYDNAHVPWGNTDAGGNSVGELTFIRTYSRLKEDGTKETWQEVCRRVIEGTYSIQKNHCKASRLPWNDRKAQASAQEAFDRMFNLKWTPPGRGLHQMGAPQVIAGNSASLQNCAVVGTGDIDMRNPGYVFQWGMEALMNGVGLGFDTLASERGIPVTSPIGQPTLFEIPDTREGWAESVGALVNSYLRHGAAPVGFDYSLIRPAGAPIKTFGGTASGPEPLRKIHDQIRSVLESNSGTTLSSKTIVDIFNLIGTCVVAGNVRRSAEIALGSYGDDDFLELKNPDVFPDRNSYDASAPGWAWSSNNSINVPVGADYSQYIDKIVSNGEPGFIWLDVAKSMGRGKDGQDDKDRRVVGFNPCCLAPDTTIMTTDGPRKISEIGAPFTAIVNGVEHTASAPWVSGTGDIYRLKTVEGYEIELTPEHRIMLESGEWAEAQSLKQGDVISLNTHGVLSWGRTDDFGEGYVSGLFVGDGNFSTKGVSTRNRSDVKIGDATFKAELKVWDIAGDDADMADYAEKIASEYATRSDWAGWSQVSDRPYQSMSVTNLIRSVGISPNNKHDISVIEDRSSEFYKGFLRGLFDADGHVEGYLESPSHNGLSIRLGQSDYKLLQSAQRMLLRLGISSRIYKARDAGQSLLPDGNGGKRFYDTKASYRLVISADSAIRYADEIGFLHRGKAEKLSHAISWRKRVYKKPFTATVDSFEFTRRGEVWDAEVSGVHAFDANGIMAHNSEQPLESFEMCTLTTVHLQNHDSKADLLRTLKFAFLYAKTVTLLPTPWPRTNAVMQRNRRIGLSLTGITDVLDSEGMPFLVDAMESGYEEIRRLDSIYSEWLCVRESNRVTTIKPEGTVSIISGASPGIHWTPGGHYFLRAIRFSDSDTMLPLFRAAGYLVEKDRVSANTQVVYFPVKSSANRSEKDVTIFEKIGLAAKAQHHWSDNGVSVTVSFDKKNESDLISPALRLHEGALKAVSFLPMDNTYYPQMPYSEITKDEYEAFIGKLKKIDFNAIYTGADLSDAEIERYCSNDSCTI